MSWWQALLLNWPGRRARRQLTIPDELWAWMLALYPFIAARSETDLFQLRDLSARFLATKEFHGAHGLVVTDEMAVAIAAQACLPVLRLGLGPYCGFVGIVVHSDEVVARRSITDEAGVVHEYDEWLSGEAMEGGPVMLSWSDVAMAGETVAGAYNVVIHEFAHVLDMSDGECNGMPALGNAADRAHWAQCLGDAYDAFCGALDGDVATFLDPYGAQTPEEFFAVATEAFFVQPRGLRAEHPDLYGLLESYFQQDPAITVQA